jgi:hypothetical protein
MRLPRHGLRAAFLLALLGLGASGCVNDRCRPGGWHRGDDRHGGRYDCDRHRRGDRRS